MNKLPITRKRINKRKIVVSTTLAIAIFILIIAGVIMTDNFFDHYDLKFQSPILFQTPIKVNERLTNLVSPLGIRKANAQEKVIENPYNPKSPKGIAWEANKKRFGVENWEALETLIQKESGWNPYSLNGSSGACGLGQAMPCSKMNCENWDYDCQINWVLDYIENRYETPKGALAHWMARKPINGKDVGNWY